MKKRTAKVKVYERPKRGLPSLSSYIFIGLDSPRVVREKFKQSVFYSYSPYMKQWFGFVDLNITDRTVIRCLEIFNDTATTNYRKKKVQKLILCQL